MRAITARAANHTFSQLLFEVENGAEVVITKHGRPVAVIVPYKPPASSPQREAAIRAAIEMMDRGIDLGPDFTMPSREEMHER